MFVKSTQDVDIWMQIAIQHNVYIFCVHLSQLFYFKFRSSVILLLPLFIYSNNILKCINLIEIRFYSYFYTVLHHLSLYFDIIMFDITTRYRKLNSGANMDIWEQITNTDFRPLLDMQKQTYSTKHVINEIFALIFHILARKPN